MSVTMKRWTPDGNRCLGTVELTYDQLVYIWHSLRAVDPDLRSPDLEAKIGKLIQADTTS